MHFFSTLVAAGTAALALAAPVKQKRVKNFQYFGVNESGAEFGAGNLPGTLGTDYTWPVTSTIDTLTAKGFNIFRIPILMERIIPNEMTGPVNAAYLASLTSIVNYITQTKGVYAIIDCQNFGRYYGTIMETPSDFQTFWATLSSSFKTNSKVLFDINNEYHDMPNTLVFSLNQAAITGIRSSGATTQTILVEGNAYTGAWTWVSSGNGATLGALTDPNDNLVYEMHQYLDSDGSGTSSVCVNSTIGADRIAAATQWLRTNNKKGLLGEFAGGANPTCIAAVEGMLAALKANSDVWLGALMWGGGPWWGDYMFSVEPPSGTAYENVLPSVLPFI
ncbi:MAG: hypothetical protein M1827_001040 [Pycnora praestabilis]|nr:MAG: hypothetical protein M1827_001040 [Pycnora praestabilis]